jgi:hypothetical protein
MKPPLLKRKELVPLINRSLHPVRGYKHITELL